MRKAIFVTMTTLAATAVVAVGTSAFAVAIAPPDVHGQVQDLPSIISGAWSPVEFDASSTAGDPIAVAGPVAEPIGQQAKEEPTTDPSDEAAGEGTRRNRGFGRREMIAQAPGGGFSTGVHGDKVKKDQEAKDKADKKKADKEKADKGKKARRAKRNEEGQGRQEKDKKEKREEGQEERK